MMYFAYILSIIIPAVDKADGGDKWGTGDDMEGTKWHGWYSGVEILRWLLRTRQNIPWPDATEDVRPYTESIVSMGCNHAQLF